MLHIVIYAPYTVNGRPLVFHKQDWTNEKKTREIRKSGFVFVVKLNIVNVKKKTFFRSHENAAFCYFASNTINGRPRNSKSNFGPILRNMRKSKNQASFLSSNSIKSTWNLGF